MVSIRGILEFLTNYGWAFLIFIAITGALVYLGILTPNQLLKEKCVLERGLNCIAYRITPTSAVIVVQNTMSKDLRINSIGIAGCDSVVGVDLYKGEEKSLVIENCYIANKGTKLNEDIEIEYTEKETMLTRKITGSIIAKVE